MSYQDEMIDELLTRIESVEPDAKRYRVWRDSMLSEDTDFVDNMKAALPLEVGTTRPPTAQEWDAAIDAALAKLPADKP